MALRRPATERFWEKVDKASSPDGCWLWTGARSAFGHGHFQPVTTGPNRSPVPAHRWSFEELVGPVPSGAIVMHRCDNPPCVNPAHLRVGTQADNIRDCVSKGRHPNAEKTMCIHGHPYTPENTYRRRNGKRYCRECQLKSILRVQKARRARQKAERISSARH